MSCSATQVTSQMPSSTTQVNYSQTASTIVQLVGGSSSTVIGEHNSKISICQHSLYVFHITVTTVSTAVVAVMVSVISTAIISSIIVWCVMKRRRPSSHDTTDHDKVTELATVIYDTPSKEQNISTQDNVAYGQVHNK